MVLLGPPLKKSRRLKDKAKVKEEQEITQAGPADVPEDGGARVDKKGPSKAAAARLSRDDGENDTSISQACEYATP